ncbi:MAG: ketoacyl-ACP synthase III [Oscillospiraceae bacterium]|nr:ketoacyl-ACP synthase III [Oscillospiraceae bacterium]
MSFRIVSTGSFVPPKVVTNEELTTFLDTSDEWITERTGVKERRVATTETAATMGVEAGRRALEAAGMTPDQLDMILCATISGEYVSPGVACLIQAGLGAACPAFDISAACSGYIYALDTAAGFFARNRVKNMLVIGAEQISRLLDWTDRNTAVIFGDGAGACLLEAGDNYITSKLFSRGGADVIQIPTSIGNSPFFEKEQVKPLIHMKGQETFRFAVGAMAQDIQDVLEQAGIDPADVDHVVPHQANIRIIDAARKRLNIKPECYASNIDRYGNTSAASVPLVLDELNRAGKLNRGDIVVLAAFGGGLSSGACVIRW